MGIIIRQSLRGSFWSYFGLIIGYINMGIIMPRVLQTDQIGFIQLFAAIAVLFSRFASLGFPSVINRMFPFFRNKKYGNNGFLFLAFITVLLGFLLSVIAFFILKPNILESNLEQSPLIVEYIGLLIPVVFFRILFLILDNYNKVLYDAVTGTFWNEFVHKTINLLLIVAVAIDLIEFRQFFFGYIVSLSLPAIPLIFTLLKKGEFNLKPNFTFLSKTLIKEIIVVSLFGLANGFSGILTTNIDKIFINHYLSLEEVGIFSVCALFATIILIPSKAIKNISTGIIAQAWKKNNIKHIRDIYLKASLNQSILGSLIFMGLIVNLNNIFTILPEEYGAGRLVIIIYSLGVLIRVSNTNSGVILVTSKYYKALTYIILLQVGVAVLANMFFIPRYGIEGAALAVLSTYLFRTILITIYIKVRFNLFCYTRNHIFIILIALVSIVVGFALPETEKLIPDILIKSIPAGLIFMGLILVLQLSEEMNNLYKQLLNTIIRAKNYFW